MKHWSVINGTLFLVVAALALLVYLRPPAGGPESHRLSSLKPSEVQRLELQRKGNSPVVLHRGKGGWRITAPLTARADAFQVERLLAVLEATAVQRLPAENLARFDLDSPLARLIVDGESFAFGRINPVTGEQYVAAAAGIFPVAARYGNTLPANGYQLIAKQLFAGDEAPVRFQFARFTVAQHEGKWRVWPVSNDTSQDDIHRWVEGWQQAMALRVEPYTDGKPIDLVRVTLQDGTVVRLDILHRNGEAVVGRPDERLRYHFAAAAAKRLFAPPGSKLH